MSFRVRYSKEAREDMRRVLTHIAVSDPGAARRARKAIEKAATTLREFPFTCRKASVESPFLRELLIPFGGSGFVALFDIKSATTITILGLRHQHEADYH